MSDETNTPEGAATAQTPSDQPPPRAPSLAAHMRDTELGRHVKDKDTWLRFVYLVVFGIAFYLSILLTFAASIFQFLAKLFSGAVFPGLSEFGNNLATYQAQVTRFLTFSSDDKPFPFAPFPGHTPESGSDRAPR